MTTPTVAFKSWSASRLDDYTQCPLMAKHKHLLKTCPLCFKGVLKGKFGTDPKCSRCGKTPVKGKPLLRGEIIGGSLERYVNGTDKALIKEVKLPDEVEEWSPHPKAAALAKTLRAAHAKGKVEIEKMHKFDRNWAYLPGDDWDPRAWLFLKMDVFHEVNLKTVKIIDWKTGGVDKRKGTIHANEKYDDQLLTYKVGGLILKPKAEKAESALCFLDARQPDPTVDRGPLLRKDLKAAQDKLTRLALPMFEDTTFAPRPNDKCHWCVFRKSVGGPCPYQA